MLLLGFLVGSLLLNFTKLVGIAPSQFAVSAPTLYSVTAEGVYRPRACTLVPLEARSLHLLEARLPRFARTEGQRSRLWFEQSCYLCAYRLIDAKYTMERRSYFI